MNIDSGISSEKSWQKSIIIKNSFHSNEGSSISQNYDEDYSY